MGAESSRCHRRVHSHHFVPVDPISGPCRHVSLQLLAWKVLGAVQGAEVAFLGCVVVGGKLASLVSRVFIRGGKHVSVQEPEM